jgi:hypothetical protein
MREPPAGVEPAPSRLEDGRRSVRRRGQENTGEPAGNRTRYRGFADHVPRQRTGSGSGQRDSNPHRRGGGPPSYLWTIPADTRAARGNRTPVTSLARSYSTIELPPRENWSEQRESNPHRQGGILPSSPLDDARAWEAASASPRAARENCTRHLLYTRQGPRSLGLSSATWWNRSESNRLPPDCRSGALPVELRSQGEAGRPAPWSADPRP